MLYTNKHTPHPFPAHYHPLPGYSDTSAPHTACPSLQPHHPSTSTIPSTSTTSSLAPMDCGGRFEERLDSVLSQEPSAYKTLQLNLALQQAFRGTIARVEEALRNNQQMQVCREREREIER